MAKYKVNPSSLFQVSIIGISTPLKDYVLAHSLRKSINIEFQREDDLPVFFSKQNSFERFAFYTCIDAELLVSYYIIKNKNSNAILIPEYKQADYFLFIDGVNNKQVKNDMLNVIRLIPAIQLAFKVNKELIKNIENVMTDIELHIADVNKI